MIIIIIINKGDEPLAVGRAGGPGKGTEALLANDLGIEKDAEMEQKAPHSELPLGQQDALWRLCLLRY